jgi:hypothetical protein
MAAPVALHGITTFGAASRMKTFSDLLADVANLFTILASGIVIYLFFSNRKKISAAVNILLNYSFQTTLNELKEKLERLNEYSANEVSDLEEIRAILHEIAGQIRGNIRLSRSMPTLADKVERLGNAKKIMETSKRSIISELREQLKNIQVDSIESIAGSDHE